MNSSISWTLVNTGIWLTAHEYERHSWVLTIWYVLCWVWYEDYKIVVIITSLLSRSISVFRTNNGKNGSSTQEDKRHDNFRYKVLRTLLAQGRGRTSLPSLQLGSLGYRSIAPPVEVTSWSEAGHLQRQSRRTDESTWLYRSALYTPDQMNGQPEGCKQSEKLSWSSSQAQRYVTNMVVNIREKHLWMNCFWTLKYHSRVYNAKANAKTLTVMHEVKKIAVVIICTKKKEEAEIIVDELPNWVTVTEKSNTRDVMHVYIGKVFKSSACMPQMGDSSTRLANGVLCEQSIPVKTVTTHLMFFLDVLCKTWWGASFGTSATRKNISRTRISSMEDSW